MTEDYFCPECGSLTEELKLGLTTGVKCTKCNWSLVTTYIPPIEQDPTMYTISLSKGNYQNKDHIKTVSKISGVNFLCARKLLQQNKSVIFQGKATEIKRIKFILEHLNITVNIDPEFYW